MRDQEIRRSGSETLKSPPKICIYRKLVLENHVVILTRHYAWFTCQKSGHHIPCELKFITHEKNLWTPKLILVNMYKIIFMLKCWYGSSTREICAHVFLWKMWETLVWHKLYSLPPVVLLGRQPNCIFVTPVCPLFILPQFPLIESNSFSQAMTLLTQLLQELLAIFFSLYF